MSHPNDPVFRMDPGTFHVQDPDAAEPAPPAAPEAAEEAERAEDIGETAPAEDAAPEPARAPTPVRTKRPRPPVRWGDLVTSIVLILLLAGAATMASIFAAFLTFASTSCGPVGCNYDVMGIGVGVALISPWIVFALAVVGVILLVIARRLSFWVPLTAFALMVALWLVGALLVWAGTG